MIKFADLASVIGQKTENLPVSLSDFLYTAGDEPTEDQLRVAQLLVDSVSRHREKPDFAPPNTLARSEINLSDLSEDSLLNAGYVPSYIAVPERGQTQLKTYRHPFNGTHFHLHGDKWRFHEDKWNSAQMLMKRYDIEHPTASDAERLKYFTSVVLPDSAGHIINEGFPNYVLYAKDSILGNDAVVGDNKPSAMRAAKGIGATALGLAAARKLLTGKARPVESLLTTGGFVGSAIAADKLGDFLTSKKPEIFGVPGAANTVVRGVLPIAGALATDYFARKAMDWLNGDKKKRRKKRNKRRRR